MKKGQVSIEFIIIISIILLISIFFANLVFGTTETSKSIQKIKLRTLDLITLDDSTALLTRINTTVSAQDLNLTLHFRGGTELGLSDANYSEVINNIKDTTSFQRVNLFFVYD